MIKMIGSIFVAVCILLGITFAVPLSMVNPYIVGAYSNGDTDSATGLGSPILSQGTWFMYNEYSGGTGSYDIQAGNPKGGENIVGSYQVTDNGDGTYTVAYNMNAGITVVDEHLGISDSMNFTAAPGQDDNQDFGTTFGDADGEFYVFAHFALSY